MKAEGEGAHLEALKVMDLIKDQISSSKFFAIFAVAATGVSLIASIFAGMAVRSDPIDTGYMRAALSSAQLDRDMQQRIEEARLELNRSKTTASVPQLASSVDLGPINKRLEAIERSQSQLNSIILASPEKAVAIPMMRRDIDDLKSSNTQMADALKREIDRIYDLNKWIIGGLGAGVLSLSISQFFRRREKATSGT